MAWLFPNILTLAEPQKDNLASKAEGHYFRDALAIKLNKTELTSSQLQHAIFSHIPAWITHLMRIRNSIVKLIGFKADSDNLIPKNDELAIGDKAGFLTISEKFENEIISVSDDKHMCFYLSVLKDADQVIISTLVNQKTIRGRLYVNCILPFHYVIARTVLNNALKNHRV